LLSVVAALFLGDEPADDEATEQVKHQIQVEALVFNRAEQQRDVPHPDAIGLARQKVGRGPRGMAEPIAAVAHGLMFGQNSGHAAQRAQIAAFV
jgi:hypothetical protein